MARAREDRCSRKMSEGAGRSTAAQSSGAPKDVPDLAAGASGDGAQVGLHGLLRGDLVATVSCHHALASQACRPRTQ
jgi:hypothetical protein